MLRYEEKKTTTLRCRGKTKRDKTKNNDLNKQQQQKTKTDEGNKKVIVLPFKLFLSIYLNWRVLLWSYDFLNMDRAVCVVHVVEE